MKPFLTIDQAKLLLELIQKERDNCHRVFSGKENSEYILSGVDTFKIFLDIQFDLLTLDASHSTNEGGKL